MGTQFDYEEFDKTLNKEDISSLFQYEEQRTKTEFKEIPDGEYFVAITYITVGYTKSTNKPVLKATFRIVEGEYQNCCIYMNQLLTSGYGILIAKKFMESLKTRETISYDNYDAFKKLVDRLADRIKKDVEYELKYTTDGMGYKKYEVLGVYDLV